MAIMTTLNNLCAPAYIYFVISAVFLILGVIFVSNGSHIQMVNILIKTIFDHIIYRHT